MIFISIALKIAGLVFLITLFLGEVHGLSILESVFRASCVSGVVLACAVVWFVVYTLIIKRALLNADPGGIEEDTPSEAT